jgi:ribosomal protein S27AE
VGKVLALKIFCKSCGNGTTIIGEQSSPEELVISFQKVGGYCSYCGETDFILK